MSKEIRPWGFFEVLLDENDYKVKRITVNPGHRLSYQYHYKRDEDWLIVNGSAFITLNDKTLIKNKGEHVKIERKTKHRVENKGKEELVFIEVQTGEYFGEDDIVRINDDYQRA